MIIVTSSEDIRHNIDDRIDQYINGKLSQEQIDEIWIDALCDDRNYSYLKTSSYLKEYFKPHLAQTDIAEAKSIQDGTSNASNIIIASIIVALIVALLIFWGMN